jgi:hypothetical protein
MSDMADGPENQITRQQGYDAMFLFLREFCNRGASPSDDPVEWLLVAMDRRTSDGGSNDPAMDSDWADCVKRIVSGVDPYAGLFDTAEPPPHDG